MSTLRLTPTPQTHKTHQGHRRTAGPRLDFMSAYILRLDFMSASPNARLYVGDLSYYIYPPPMANFLVVKRSRSHCRYMLPLYYSCSYNYPTYFTLGTARTLPTPPKANNQAAEVFVNGYRWKVSKSNALDMLVNTRRPSRPPCTSGNADFVVPVLPHLQKISASLKNPKHVRQYAPAAASTTHRRASLKGPNTRRLSLPQRTGGSMDFVVPSSKNQAPNTFANTRRLSLPQRTGGSMDLVIPSSKNQAPNMFANTRQPPLPQLAGGTADFVVIASDSRASSMDPTSGSTDFVGTIKTQEVN
ncbi:hypothetical protein C8J57DRAFT_1493470 [Mycena rebaudengoi]|nr:hypothetical protein C8J57DRAFT_1493470 [Mycena rebaudengoi]